MLVENHWLEERVFQNDLILCAVCCSYVDLSAGAVGFSGMSWPARHDLFSPGLPNWSMSPTLHPTGPTAPARSSAQL